MQSYNFSRSVPVEEGYDVLVAGGGPAGSAAAVCAARLGAKVLLVEATGSLGGMSTSGRMRYGYFAWMTAVTSTSMIISGNASAPTPIKVLVGKTTSPQVSLTHWPSVSR